MAGDLPSTTCGSINCDGVANAYTALINKAYEIKHISHEAVQEFNEKLTNEANTSKDVMDYLGEMDQELLNTAGPLTEEALEETVKLHTPDNREAQLEMLIDITMLKIDLNDEQATLTEAAGALDLEMNAEPTPQP